MPRKILILGGARFHGYQLAEYLSGSGNEVYVLNRGNYKQDMDSDINHLIADRNNIDNLKAVLSDKQFDAVIDNNAYNPQQINVALNLLSDKCEHYIFTSTVAVYQTLSSRNKLKEGDASGISDTPYTPGVKEYGLNKLAAENALVRGAERLNYTILRFPNIYGEGDFAGKLSYFYYRLMNGGKVLIVDEVKKFSIIYVKDVIRSFGTVLLNIKCYGKTLNIADPEEYNPDSFFRNVYGGMYSPDKIITMPAQDMWNKGYSYSFPWSSVLDTSLYEGMAGDFKYTSLNRWGKGALEWEIKHFGDRSLDADFARQREVELRLIKEYDG